jgi:PAS domain S-box-containing protein
MAARDGTLVYINQAWNLATGYSAEELAERRLADLLHSDCRAEVEAALQGVLAGQAVSHLEAVVVTKSGEALMLEGSVSGLGKDGTVAMICGIFRDITERRRMEEHLRRAERMQAAGRLAGGVAHEVNNMMTGVIGFASLLRNSFEDGDGRVADVREILRAAGRAADLTRQLLAFTRQQLRRVEPLDLNDVLGDLERMLRRTVGEEHEFALRLRPGGVRVAADRGQLEQVLINLVLNARDAIDGNGRVAIETDVVELDASYASRHPGVAIPTARYAMLAVSDTGSGMSPEVQTRIFEPFFTTKPVGRGTGLGLSTVYGIVKQSEGFVWAYSELGVGSVFKLYLPLAPEQADVNVFERTDPPAAIRGTERVLIVEDEEVVRTLASRCLREQGYRVAEAADGAAAIDYLRMHASEIDLVVSDVVMPTMGGRELGQRLTELAPSLPVLYISGFTGDDVVNRGLLDPSAPFLQKPFAPEVLALKVRELLDRARATA